MAFRDIFLIAFHEENLLPSDYLCRNARELTAWRKLFNPVKWAEFIILIALYSIINPIVRLVVLVAAIAKVFILSAWVVLSYFTSLIISLLCWFEDIPVGKTFDAVRDFLVGKLGKVIAGCTGSILNGLSILFISFLFAIPKCLIITLSPLNAFLIPLRKYMKNPILQSILFTLLIAAYSYVVLSVLALSGLYLPAGFYMICLSLNFFSAARLFKPILWDKLKKEDMQKKEEKTEEEKVCGEENKIPPVNSTPYDMNSSSFIFLASPKESACISLEEMNKWDFYSRVNFAFKKFCGFNPISNVNNSKTLNTKNIVSLEEADRPIMEFAKLSKFIRKESDDVIESGIVIRSLFTLAKNKMFGFVSPAAGTAIGIAEKVVEKSSSGTVPSVDGTNLSKSAIRDV